MIDTIKSFIVGTIAIVALIAMIGGIIKIATWCTVHLNPLIIIGGLAFLSFLYFAYQLGKEIRRND